MSHLTARGRNLPGGTAAAVRAAAVLVAYTGLAVLLFWQTWLDPFHRMVGCGGPGLLLYGHQSTPTLLQWEMRGDCLQYAWQLDWPSYALTHLQNPIFTYHLGYPTGANSMWTTVLTVVGGLLAPVSIAAGPIFTYNVAVTLAVVSSAWAAYLAIARLVPNRTGAALGGLVYGFSPYMQAHALTHLNYVLVAFPPVVLLLLHEILVRRRWPVWLPAVLLGTAAAAQLLTSSEILATTALAAVVGVALLALLFPRRVVAALPRAAAGGAIALAVFAMLGAYPLWMQFFGPERVLDTFKDADYWTNDLLSLVVPTHLYLLSPGSLASLAQNWTSSEIELNAYLGLPLLLLLAVVIWRCWSSPVVRWAAGFGVVLLVFSLGPHLHVNGQIHHKVPLPWLLIWKLPVLGNVLPDRLGLYAFLAVGILLAVAVERLWAARGAPLRLAGAAALGVALVPLLPALPWPAATMDVPTFFTSASTLAAIPPDSTALVVPFTTEPGIQPGPAPSDAADPMLWQAIADYRFRMPSGYIRTPGPHGELVIGPPQTLTEQVLIQVAGGQAPPALTASMRSQMVADLQRWQVETVIVGPMPNQAQEVRLLTDVLGRPPTSEGGVYVWTGTLRALAKITVPFMRPGEAVAMTQSGRCGRDRCLLLDGGTGAVRGAGLAPA